MRVAYLVNQYPSISHTFVRREIEALERLGVQVSRYSLRPMNEKALPDPADQRELSITHALLGRGGRALLPSVARLAASRPALFARAEGLTMRIGKRSERGLLRNFAYLAEACALVEQLEKAEVRHVHAHFGTNSAAVAMLAHELGGPTYSFTAHGPEEFDKPDLIALREKIARAAFVVGVSSFGRSQLYRYCAAKDWGKVHVVRCGVDASYMARAPSPVPDVPRLVSVGRLSEQKGQLLLVEAAALLKNEGRVFELVLVGDGPMRPEVEALIARERLGQHVRITGWASGDEVRSEIEASRVFVLPSFAEGLPVVLMEALGRGRPVITTYIAGIPELVQTEVNGWLVPAGSVADVAVAMRAALDASVERLTEMGRVGYERVREMHDAERNAAVLAELFARYAQ
ncbi:MAG: colanic acid biosynthesis glycosyltransferase WcaL [Myxococcaceae bacterium]|nr:colanic acid biosynthesis glycosyltransferase WcaL [Myxococcaceae bacterium]